MTGRRASLVPAIPASTALLVLLWPALALAEASVEDQARARELFERGVAAARDEDYPGAIEAFEESFRLYPHPGTLLNLGLYQLRDGRRIDACRTLTELMARYHTVLSERARSEVDQRLEELHAVLAMVSLSSRPLGATISIDGVDRGRTPLETAVALEPGSHTFVASLDGYETAEEVRQLEAGEESTVELVLSPVPSAEPGPPVLVVQCRTEGAVISIDGEAPERLPLRRELAPGVHELSIEAPGHAPQTRPVTLPDVGEVSLEVELLPLGGTTPPDGPTRRPLWRRPWVWVVGSVVVLGVSAAIAVPLAVNRDEPDWIMRGR